ncbi:hypothetical protein GQ53DRAFT_753409 [Thozetella sp. PMI_491]|nr:hypothetical protein GQ53DRAFT_753409 [Thozetella sp. PMI_491]
MHDQGAMLPLTRGHPKTTAGSGCGQPERAEVYTFGGCDISEGEEKKRTRHGSLSPLRSLGSSGASRDRMQHLAKAEKAMKAIGNERKRQRNLWKKQRLHVLARHPLSQRTEDISLGGNPSERTRRLVPTAPVRHLCSFLQSELDHADIMAGKARDDPPTPKPPPNPPPSPSQSCRSTRHAY